MEAHSLTPIQQDLLRLFSFDHSDSFANEIKSILNSYFQKRIENETDRLWENGILDQTKLDALRGKDLHKE